MILPDQVYQLSDIDLSKTRSQLIRVFATAAVAATAVTCGPIYIVPDGYVLLIQSGVGIATPGAGQNFANMYFRFQIDGQVLPVVSNYVPGAANVVCSMNMSPGMFAPAGTVIHLLGNFNAGGAANTLQAWLVGWLLPKGGMAV